MRKESRRSHSVRAFISLHRIAYRIAVVVSLLVSTAPLARAQQPDALKFFKNYFVTGDMIVAGTQFGSASVNGKTKAIINMAGAAAGSDALAAFLYWQTDESSDTPAGSVGLFDGHKIVGIQIGDRQNPGCNAKYGRVYRADVLRYLEIDQVANLRKPNGSHTVALTDSGNGRVRPNGATLVIVYRIVVPGKPTIAPLRALVAYDGAFTTTLGPMRQTIAGFYDASSPAAKMVDIAAYQQGGFTVKVNGVTIGSGSSTGNTGRRWDNPIYNIHLTTDAKSLYSSYSTELARTNNGSCQTVAAIWTSTQARDTDFDGLLDAWELYGLHLNDHLYDKRIAATFGGCSDYPKEQANCVNLPAMGANPNRKDIFIELDRLKGNSGNPKLPLGHEHKPKFEALQRVYGLFAAHNIAVHFDAGPDYPAAPFIIPTAAIGNVPHPGGEVIDETLLECPNKVIKDPSKCNFPSSVYPYAVLSYVRGFNAVKEGSMVLGIPPHFAHARNHVFHYALFGHAFASYEFDPNTFLPILDANGKPKPTNPLKSVSGVGDRPGGNFMITLGLWRFDSAADDEVGSVDAQAGTLTHELGHNLGLSHAGLYRTPNCWGTYQSPMNYLYQVVPNISLSDGRQFALPLNEKSLDETQPLNLAQQVRYYAPAKVGFEGSAKVHCDGTPLEGKDRYEMVRIALPDNSKPDWNRNGIQDKTTYPLDINFDGKEESVFLTSNDWDSLNLQQVGARLNVNGLSLDIRWQDVFRLIEINGKIFNLGAIEPGAIEPGVDSGAIEPGAIEPGAIEPGAIEPGAIEPGAIEPGASVDLGAIEPGAIEPGGPWEQLGAIEPGAIEPGAIEPGAIEPGAIEPGAIEPGAIEPGDLPYLVLIKSDTGSTAPQNVAAANDKDSITVTWDHPAFGEVVQYNIWRSDPDHPLLAGRPFDTCPVPNTNPRCTIDPNAPPFKYRDAVTDFINAGVACPNGKTCYNTQYTYYLTALVKADDPPTVESGQSNTASSEVTHLFVEPDNKIATYGDALPPATFTIYGDGSRTFTISPACSYPSPAPRNATNKPTGEAIANPYAIACTGDAIAADGKTGVSYGQPYNDGILHGPGVLKIIQRQITVTATADTKIYDGTTSSTRTPTITSGTLASGDEANFSQAFDSPHVDATKVKVLGTVNDGNSGNNYAYTLVDAAGTITPRPTTVTADPKSKVYGEADPPLTYQVVNNPPTSYPLVAGDSFTGKLSRAAGESVGTYAIQRNTLNLSADYNLTYVGADFTITPRPVTVTADPQQKIYGNADPALTYHVVNNPPTSYPLLNGDSFTGALSREPGEDKGEYNITQGTLSLSSNYNLTFKGAKLTINPKSVSAAVTAANKVYDGTTAATITTCTLSGVLTGDAEAVNCSATSASFVDANIGTGKPVAATVVLGGTRAFNYTLASPTVGTFADIVPKPDTTITDGPANNSTIQTNTTSFSFTGTGGLGSLRFECKLETAELFAPCSSPYTLAGLLNGVHKFSVRAVDAAGNADPSPDTRAFWVLAVSWSLKAPFQDPRTLPERGPSTGIEGGAAGLIGGKIYVSHGYRQRDTNFLSIYDIASDTWTHGGSSAPDASIARAEMAGGVAAGKYYAIGGRTGPTDAVEQFNPATTTWSTVASLSQARGGLGAASWNDKIYAVGGRSGAAFGDGTIYGTFEVYNPATNTWTTLAALPTPVSDIYATVGYNGKIYVFGGATGPNTVISTVQIYDIATNTWTTGVPMPTARAAAMAGVIGGQIAVFGGFVPDPAPAFERGTNLKVTEFYNPVTNTWTTGPDMLQGVSEISQGVTYDGMQIFSIGTGIFGPSGSVVQVLK